MASDKRLGIGILLVSTFLGAVGQFLFKYAFGVHSLFVELIVAGFIAYMIATVMYFYVLSRMHLSWAYSIGGLSYIFTTIFAATILSESVPLLRWIGVVVIAAGVLLIGLS
ncbi:MAG TPA: hypothetical protein VND15_02360 [Candidatus Acidoferrales bacterium]|nr:hypothetical protein [Candidatus Acidoferrales bacterium]